MNKKRTAAIAVTFFLVQIILLSGVAPAESLSPNLLTKIYAGAPGLQLKESCFQPKIPVLSELTIEKTGVTLQILPGIDDMLNDCKIKPNRIYPPSPADKSA